MRFTVEYRILPAAIDAFDVETKSSCTMYLAQYSFFTFTDKSMAEAVCQALNEDLTDIRAKVAGRYDSSLTEITPYKIKETVHAHC